jgi:hypothetical protein
MKKLLIMNYIATVISNLFNGYIHLYWTSPLTFTSYGTCVAPDIAAAHKIILELWKKTDIWQLVLLGEKYLV